MNATDVKLWVILVEHAPAEFGIGPEAETLAEAVKTYPGKTVMVVDAGDPAAVDDATVQRLTNVLLARWLLAQFGMMAQAMNRVQPARTLVKQ